MKKRSSKEFDGTRSARLLPSKHWLGREGFGSFCSHEVVQRIHVDVEVDAAHPL